MIAMEVAKIEKERVRKRPLMTWEESPTEPEAKRAHETGHDSVTRHLSPPRRNDDREGHYVFNLEENLTPRYKTLSKMGEGTFGRVLECWDRKTREYVAIKVVRSIRKYRDAAMIEVDVLQKLAKNDDSSLRCVRIKNWFDYRNHICIVFEKLGPSLFDFQKKNKYCSFPVDLVREFGRQLLESVAYMHDLQFIHTDLKPENILLVSSEYVKLPDRKGEALFQTHDNLEHLAMMERVLGPLPEHMTRKANNGAEKYFRKGSRLNWPEGAISRGSIKAVKKLDRIKDMVSKRADSSRHGLADLLYGLLAYDPSDRLTARQALQHPFFRFPT